MSKESEDRCFSYYCQGCKLSHCIDEFLFCPICYYCLDILIYEVIY